MNLLANKIYFLSILLGPAFPRVIDPLFSGTESGSVNIGDIGLPWSDHLPGSYILIS